MYSIKTMLKKHEKYTFMVYYLWIVILLKSEDHGTKSKKFILFNSSSISSILILQFQFFHMLFGATFFHFNTITTLRTINNIGMYYPQKCNG